MDFYACRTKFVGTSAFEMLNLCDHWITFHTNLKLNIKIFLKSSELDETKSGSKLSRKSNITIKATLALFSCHTQLWTGPGSDQFRSRSDVEAGVSQFPPLGSDFKKEEEEHEEEAGANVQDHTQTHVHTVKTQTQDPHTSSCTS